jgi:hypothetical protein
LYPHVYTFLKNISFTKLRLKIWSFDMGIAGFEHHMKEKGVEYFLS